MPSQTLEFFFDYSCPYAYLASTQIEKICEKYQASLQWRPMLLGGVFKALEVPQNMATTMSPAKVRHNLADMQRWASLWKVPFSMSPSHPMRTVNALRLTLLVPQEYLAKTIHAFYRAYWVENLDITDLGVLEKLLNETGQDGASLCQSIDQTVKDKLRKNTEEAIERGVFGAPSIFLHEKLFWGQDRLWMVEKELGATPSLPGEGQFSRKGKAPAIDFWFDFSSPFSYLASTQIEKICEKYQAPLRWRPMLLGGVFKTLGGPIVPMQTFSASKQRYQAQDIDRWKTYWNIDFSWPSRFPMKTVKPLRIALSLGEKEMLPFCKACYRAYWVEDRDLDDMETLASILQEVGQDPQKVQAATEPTYKEALIHSTKEAVEKGVFGAPTMIGNDYLFWGQDRLFLLERFLEGWTPPV